MNLYNENKDRQFETIEISFQQWFAANLSSALGGVMDKLLGDLNTIRFNDISPDILTIIQKNDFLSHFGYQRVTDINNNTIRYLKLKPTDGRYFQRYVLKELLDRPELSIMNSALKRKIAESIYEIFVNAQIHSESDFIYTCGQFFPTKESIEFTITDTGVGFRKRVNSRFEKKLSSVQAIKWAMKDGHSTKQGISGGIGLAILKEFVILNKGKIQIISDDGFYQLDPNGVQTRLFSGSFPGTIINMEFKTDNVTSYSLISETESDELF
ncbi:MAG: ATP-binding protein [Desulfobacteraceae bacterium]|nr:ATP-binding protein [Desulfobacteraceae bacterium]MBC2719374.1 ATP-binding protein [Desulfobacteraceae bacterium]